MGKRILVQRRGRGGSVFRAKTYKRVAPVSFPPLSDSEFKSAVQGIVEDIVHDPGRGAPLALIKFEDGKECYLPAPEGLSIYQNVSRGFSSTPEIGNILPIGKIPEGTLICNVEANPGDGGKLARASGSYALVVAHTQAGTEVKLPSGKSIILDDNCRAMVGVVAGTGRIEKPFIKAGTKIYLMKSKGRKWPRVKGQAMVAASHPFGGGRHKHAGKPTTVSRHAPPGAKVGSIAARKTGRGKKKIKKE
ncbi:MAG: 50S ribosomal protein L2 [Candidatus Bathyarchaeia archaeon]